MNSRCHLECGSYMLGKQLPKIIKQNNADAKKIWMACKGGLQIGQGTKGITEKWKKQKF